MHFRSSEKLSIVEYSENALSSMYIFSKFKVHSQPLFPQQEIFYWTTGIYDLVACI